MSKPVPDRHMVCDCGHHQCSHIDKNGQCCVEGCTCVRFTGDE